MCVYAALPGWLCLPKSMYAAVCGNQHLDSIGCASGDGLLLQWPCVYGTRARETDAPAYADQTDVLVVLCSFLYR